MSFFFSRRSFFLFPSVKIKQSLCLRVRSVFIYNLSLSSPVVFLYLFLSSFLPFPLFFFLCHFYCVERVHTDVKNMKLAEERVREIALRIQKNTVIKRGENLPSGVPGLVTFPPNAEREPTHNKPTPFLYGA
jgi:hypothetical protein